MKQSYTYRSEIQEIPAIRNDLAKLQSKWAIPDSEMRQIVVMIEEIFSNILRFAYTDTREHQVQISLEKSDDEILIQIWDDGIPFNPLEHREGPVLDPAQSEDNGMGLTLIKTFSSSLSYERVDAKNHLLITKIIKSNHGHQES
jgi:anti-sigma regulatory factor (Ser/Thr protein kinase)